MLFKSKERFPKVYMYFLFCSNLKSYFALKKSLFSILCSVTPIFPIYNVPKIWISVNFKIYWKIFQSIWSPRLYYLLIYAFKHLLLL